MALKYAAQTFITVPNRNTLQAVSGHAQLVFMWMCSMQNEVGQCYPAYDTLAALTHFSRSTIIRAVKELEAFGMIVKSHRRTDNSEHANRSNLYEVMIIDTEPGTIPGVTQEPPIVTVSDPVSDRLGGVSDRTAPLSVRHPELKPLTKTTELKVDTDVSTAPTAREGYGNPDINALFAYWSQRMGAPLTSNVQRNRNACSNLIKKHGADHVRAYIDYVAAERVNPYATRVHDFCSLQAKWDALTDAGKRRQVQSMTTRIIKV